MLEFFRKYQRIFFIFITVVIVISFSFFGTYNTLPPENTRTDPAFRAVDGTLVSKAELEEMVLFLSTDMSDKLLFGGAWGPNFLNDGVVKKLLLQTDIAQLLAAQFAVDLAPDLEKRLAAEKRYSLYAHPQANFISTESAWAYFAPTMASDFKTLQQAESPITPEAFAARTRLYLAEKNFSAPMLRQVLLYQEKQLTWLEPDENLGRMDLSLYGYHTTEDWFGPRFMNLAAEFIINSAKIAEQRGYRVSKSEALTDLINNSNQSFKQNLRSPHLGVANNQEYFKEQLRRMGMDQTKAAKIWQNVLLASRLFGEAGNSVFVSPDLFSNFIAYTKEPVSGNLYQLPKELRLSDYRNLQKFELYLDAVASRSDEDKSSLKLPENYLSVDELAKMYPELVQKRYLLDIAQVDKNALQTKISVKETWNWEVEDANWAQLLKKFPNSGLKAANTRQERFALLDALNDKARTKIDNFARAQILAKRPELITQALESASLSPMSIGLSLKGPAGAPFVGINDVSVLIALLDQASVNGSESTPEQQAADKQLAHFSGDKRHYYKIQVLEKQPDATILTFATANQQGILDNLLDRTLQEHYLKIREAQPKTFQKADSSWKELADVKDTVADSYFAHTLNAIQAQENSSPKLTGNLAAPRRLLPHVKNIKANLAANPSNDAAYVKIDTNAEQTENAKAAPLHQQWQLEKRPFAIDRSSNSEQFNTVEALELAVNAWSPVTSTPNGAIFFYQKIESQPKEHDFVVDKSHQAQQLLSGEAQRIMASQLITEYKSKHAISLEFIDNGESAID